MVICLHDENEVLEMINKMILLMRPSIIPQIAFTLILLGPILKAVGSLINYDTNIFDMVLGGACILSIFVLWIIYFISKARYLRYKSEKMKEFEALIKIK